MRDVELRNRLHVLRAERRMTQQELADAIGVSRKTISTIEVGRFVPGTTIALLLADYFGLSVGEIFWIHEGSAE